MTLTQYNPLNYTLSQLRKALFSGLAAGGGVLGVAITDGSLTQSEVYGALGVAVVAFSGVFAIKNQEVPSE